MESSVVETWAGAVVFDMGSSLVSVRRRRGRGEEAGAGELDRGVLRVCLWASGGWGIVRHSGLRYCGATWHSCVIWLKAPVFSRGDRNVCVCVCCMYEDKMWDRVHTCHLY